MRATHGRQVINSYCLASLELKLCPVAGSFFLTKNKLPLLYSHIQIGMSNSYLNTRVCRSFRSSKQCQILSVLLKDEERISIALGGI